MSEKYKSIQIRVDTYEELAKKGNLTDSFDSVISRLLKKSRLLQSDSTITNSDQITTAVTTLPVKEDQSCG